MPGADEYPSCEWLQAGLAFNRRSLHTCLIVHHKTGLPFLADYAGGELPLDRVLALRAHILAAQRRGDVLPECGGCPHLRTRAWPAPAYPIEIVGIAHYAHCNIECNYCFLQTQDPASFAAGLKPYRLLPVMEALIRDGQLAPHAIIDWGGGEPTVYREFDDLLELLLNHGTFHYLHTNGTRLPPPLRRTAHPQRVHVICSVDAGLPATYVQLKKRDYLERVWTNLQAYAQLGAPVSLKYIVKEENRGLADLEAFVGRARCIGARELILDIDYDYPVPPEEIVTALGQLKALAQAAGLPARFGFTGDNFAPEQGVGERVERACQAQQQQISGRVALALLPAPSRSPGRPRYAVEWLAHDLPCTWPEGGLYQARVRLGNQGDRPWAAPHPQGQHVELAIHVNGELQRFVSLPHDVAPGGSLDLRFLVSLPTCSARSWEVKLSLVEQNVAWFADHGAWPLVVHVRKVPHEAGRLRAA